MTVVSLDRPRTELPGGRTIDEFGVLRCGSEILKSPVPSMEALMSYRFPEPEQEFLRERMESLADADGLRVCSMHDPLQARAESLAGREVLRRAMREEPAFAHELLRRTCEQSLACLECALAYPADAVLLTETPAPEPGDAESELPRFRTFIRPYLARLYAMIRAYGHPIIHSCPRALLGELEQLGLDVLLESD